MSKISLRGLTSASVSGTPIAFPIPRNAQAFAPALARAIRDLEVP
jgi:hypothetical protein